MELYKWEPETSADKDYPMVVVSGDLIYANGKSIYIPNRVDFNPGWGQSFRSVQTSQIMKPVPVLLDVTWFSWTEDTFYSGCFELPKEKMAEMFKKGFISPHTGKRKTYSNVMLGFAPGGEIAVWVGGDGIQEEVAYFKAKKADISWKRILDNEDVSRQEYITMTLEESIGREKMDKLAKYGIPYGRWQGLRKRYPWTPLVEVKDPVIMWVDYYNGEAEFADFKRGVEVKENRAVPEHVMLDWMYQGKKLSTDIDFDEQEIFAAFAKFAEIKADDPVKLKFHFHEPSRMVDVSLINSKFELELQHVTFKTYKL